MGVGQFDQLRDWGQIILPVMLSFLTFLSRCNNPFLTRLGEKGHSLYVTVPVRQEILLNLGFFLFL
jgi:hypothetical protein